MWVWACLYGTYPSSFMQVQVTDSGPALNVFDILYKIEKNYQILLKDVVTVTAKQQN